MYLGQFQGGLYENGSNAVPADHAAAALAHAVWEIAAQVKGATDEQSQAGRGITAALEKIAEDAREMRDHLQGQMRETERIAEAARTMLDIAQANDAVAREFNATVQNLVLSGRDFESEVARFRYSEGRAS